MINSPRTKTAYFATLDYEVLKIEPWGRDSIRVRATRLNAIKEDWISALLEQGEYLAEIEIHETAASLRNGALLVNVNARGELTFINALTDQELLKEKPIHALSIPARHYADVRGDLFHIDACFEAYDDEHHLWSGTASAWSPGSKGLCY